MSSIPGYTLEAYVAWNWNLVVEDLEEANTSLGIAEMLGTASPRPRITKEQFAPILAFYEPHREQCEEWLSDFDEDTQSWRSYAGYYELLTETEQEQVTDLVRALTAPAP